MSGLLRKTDLFALVGLVALLVWTPSYMGADPTTRTLMDGETIELPAPRVGDRVVFELVVRDQNGEPQAVGPIGEMTRRAVEPGEAPVDAVWVEEWRYADGSWNVSIGSLRVRGGDRAVYYDSDGVPVWYAFQDRGRVRGAVPSMPTSALNDAQGTYRFTKDPVGSTASRLAEGAGLSEDRVLSSALRHRSALYLGQGVTASVLLDRYHDIGDSRLAPDRLDGTVLLPWMFTNRGQITFDPVPEFFSVEEWTWVHPDLAGAVGYHIGYSKRAEAPFLELDILPRLIERGEGTDLPATARRGDWWVGNDFPRVAGPPQDLAMHPLREIDQDPRPVLQGVRLPDLRTGLEPQTGWSEAFQQGAHIVGFSGRVETEPSAATALSTEWMLVLLDDHDRVTMGAVRVEDGAVRDASVGCSDLEVVHREPCSGVDGINRPFVCHSLHTSWGMCPDPNPDPLDLDRLVPDPWGLWSSGILPAEEWQQVTFTPEPDVAQVSAPADGMGLFQRALFELSPERGGIHPHLGFTQIDGADGLPRTRWSLMDGQVELLEVASEPQAGPSLAQIDGADGAIAVPVRFVPGSVAAGGLLLIALSGIVRAWGSLRLFALTGVAALYARIEDDAVLKHERRDEILRALRAEPGLTASEIGRRLDLGWGVTAHHLERLRRAGLVQVRRDGRRSHHFPADLSDPERLLPDRNPDYDLFLNEVTRSPGLALRDLAIRLDRSPSTLSRTGSRLARLGLVQKRRDGMLVRFYPARTGRGTATMVQDPAGARSSA